MIWRRLAMALAVVATPVVATAQDACTRATTTGWDSINWQATVFRGIEIAELQNDEKLKAHHETLSALLKRSFPEAVRYFQSKGFPAPSLCTDVAFYIDYERDAADTAHYASSAGQIGVRGRRTGLGKDFLNVLPTADGTGLTMGDFLYVVIAHEMFHAIQHGQSPIGDPRSAGTTWIVEGTANAAGVGYAQSRGLDAAALQLTGWEPRYDLPLHRPEDDPLSQHRILSRTLDPLGGYTDWDEDAERLTLAPYSRGHFFFHLGRDLGADDGASWLATAYTDKVADGVNGLRWLDGVLAERGEGGLADYFPKFIARHAGNREMFSPAVRAEARWSVTLQPGTSQITRRIVAPVAATPVVVDLTLDGPDGVYWVEQDVVSPTPLALHTVVGKQVIPYGERYGRIMEPGDAQWVTRVVNVQRGAPWVTQQQWFELSVQATPFTIDAMCAGPGDLVQIGLESGAAADIAARIADGQMRWQISGGAQTGPMEIRAPASPGAHELHLEIKQDTGWASYPVGTVNVNPNGCMVRLLFPEGQGHATYVPDGNYTEFVGSDGTRAYFREADLAIWVPGQGWIALPADQKAMIAESLTVSPFDTIGLDPEEIALERAQNHLPLMMAEVFSISAIQAAQGNLGSAVFRNAQTGGVFADNPAGPRPSAPLDRSPVPCPQATAQGCTRSQVQLAGVHFADITHDALGRPVIVAFSPEASFGLDYETHDVQRPPGW